VIHLKSSRKLNGGKRQQGAEGSKPPGQLFLPILQFLKATIYQAVGHQSLLLHSTPFSLRIYLNNRWTKPVLIFKHFHQFHPVSIPSTRLKCRLPSYNNLVSCTRINVRSDLIFTLTIRCRTYTKSPTFDTISTHPSTRQ
jgi:hypothetical protein